MSGPVDEPGKISALIQAAAPGLIETANLYNGTFDPEVVAALVARIETALAGPQDEHYPER